jgi:hypothetical protein
MHLTESSLDVLGNYYIPPMLQHPPAQNKIVLLDCIGGVFRS